MEQVAFGTQYFVLFMLYYNEMENLISFKMHTKNSLFQRLQQRGNKDVI